MMHQKVSWNSVLHICTLCNVVVQETCKCKQECTSLYMLREALVTSSHGLFIITTVIP